jgi:RNA polymerase sigma-70 factor (ECF subfamily)
MVGSAFDGEDVVQDAVAKAAAGYHAGIERPQNWLFRIAHNTALDALRHKKRLAVFEVDADAMPVADDTAAADARVQVTASLAMLQELTPVERSCMILLDVLGHSIDEATEILSITPAAAKAALHRGRVRLRTLARSTDQSPSMSQAERARLQAYADRFNARDFDSLRSLLAEDVRLDLANRTRLSGRTDVSVYFTRYSAMHDWHFDIGFADGQPALLVSNPFDPAQIRYPVLLDWKDGQIANIRDFHYAPYVTETLEISRLPG